MREPGRPSTVAEHAAPRCVPWQTRVLGTLRPSAFYANSTLTARHLVTKLVARMEEVGLDDEMGAGECLDPVCMHERFRGTGGRWALHWEACLEGARLAAHVDQSTCHPTATALAGQPQACLTDTLFLTC